MMFGCGFLPETRDVPGCGPLQEEVSGHDLLRPKIVQVKSFECVPQHVSVCSISFRPSYVTNDDKSQLQISPVRKVESEVHTEFELGQTRETIQALQRDSLNINKSLLRVPERENDIEPQSFDSYYICQSELQNGDQLITSNDFETLSTISSDRVVKEEVTPQDLKVSNDASSIPPQLNEESVAQDNSHCLKDNEANHLEGENSYCNTHQTFVSYNHVSSKVTNAASDMDGSSLDLASWDGDDPEQGLDNASVDIPNVVSDVAADSEAFDQLRTHVMTKDNTGIKDEVRTLIKGGTDEKSGTWISQAKIRILKR